MNFKEYVSNWNSAARVAFVCACAALVLGIAVLLLSFQLLTKKDRVVLVPPYLDERVEVAWKEASSPYLRSFGLYVATLIGNVTPKNIAFVRDHLSVFMGPKAYAPVRAALTSLSQDRLFQEGANIRYFSPNDIVWEKETSRVFILGRETVANPNNAQPTIVNKVYEMTILMYDGKPVITTLTNYAGQQPRTQKWLQNNSDFAKDNPDAGQPPAPLKDSDLPTPTSGAKDTMSGALELPTTAAPPPQTNNAPTKDAVGATAPATAPAITLGAKQ